jgi:polysaccharide export outer membrane protein
MDNCGDVSDLGAVSAHGVSPFEMRLLRDGGRMTRSVLRAFVFLSLALGVEVASAAAQAPQQPVRSVRPGATTEPIVLPEGYVIGPEDVLTVIVWREKELSADVVVRPDGKISLPLLNDVQAAGLTPEQLAQVVEKQAIQYVKDSDASVIVKEIRSRKVFVIGEVAKPGVVPLTSKMTVLQLIASVGGLLEYADKSNITILRNEGGRERRMRFNYKDVIAGRNLQQNVELQPGDMVLVR